MSKAMYANETQTEMHHINRDIYEGGVNSGLLSPPSPYIIIQLLIPTTGIVAIPTTGIVAFSVT